MNIAQLQKLVQGKRGLPIPKSYIAYLKKHPKAQQEHVNPIDRFLLERWLDKKKPKPQGDTDREGKPITVVGGKKISVKIDNDNEVDDSTVLKLSTLIKRNYPKYLKAAYNEYLKVMKEEKRNPEKDLKAFNQLEVTLYIYSAHSMMLDFWVGKEIGDHWFSVEINEKGKIEQILMQG